VNVVEEQWFFTHCQLTGFSGVNGGPNGINHPPLTVLGHFLGLASAVWNQAEPRFFAFLVSRAGSQIGAPELGGPDGSGHDEFPLCRVYRGQSDATMRRHDRRGIHWNLAGRFLRLYAGSFPALFLHHYGDCRLQVRPVSGQPGALRVLPRRVNNADCCNLRDSGSLRCMGDRVESSAGNSRRKFKLFVK